MKEMVRMHNGVLKTYPAKPALTPKKLSAIRSQYFQRIYKHCADSTEFSERISDIRFNKLLNSNITNNITRMKKENMTQFTSTIDATQDSSESTKKQINN